MNKNHFTDDLEGLIKRFSFNPDQTTLTEADFRLTPTPNEAVL
jgi:hypothetical protein